MSDSNSTQSLKQHTSLVITKQHETSRLHITLRAPNALLFLEPQRCESYIICSDPRSLRAPVIYSLCVPTSPTCTQLT
jgi:hypothetical protein